MCVSSLVKILYVKLLKNVCVSLLVGVPLIYFIKVVDLPKEKGKG